MLPGSDWRVPNPGITLRLTGSTILGTFVDRTITTDTIWGTYAFIWLVPGDYSLTVDPASVPEGFHALPAIRKILILTGSTTVKQDIELLGGAGVFQEESPAQTEPEEKVTEPLPEEEIIDEEVPEELLDSVPEGTSLEENIEPEPSPLLLEHVTDAAAQNNGEVVFKIADAETGKIDGEALTGEEALTVLLDMATSQKDVEEIVENVMKETTPLSAEITDAIETQVSETMKEEVIEKVVEAVFEAGEVSDDAAENEATVEEAVKEMLAENPVVEEEVTKVIDEAAKVVEVVEVVEVPENMNEESTTSTTPTTSTTSIPLVPGIAVRVTDRKGNPVDLDPSQFSFKAGSVLLVVRPIRRFTPGLYTIEFILTNPITGETSTIEQDFTWGVLAMNADKDRYRFGETAEIAIGVLDDEGEIVCDATVTLSVMHTPFDTAGRVMLSSPEAAAEGRIEAQGRPTQGDTTILSTVDNTIETTGTCGLKQDGFIGPDFRTAYTFGEEGTYTLTLTAETANGTREMTQEVSVIPSSVLPEQDAYRGTSTGGTPFDTPLASAPEGASLGATQGDTAIIHRVAATRL